ncbi:YbfB/YjiJ family MFS transporter [Comamonadaceae bacterium OTU4NAUVB1]|nr:YbfB/YjiJ family MFS transporter [Comamonadaceae bacterium OTU4NAUVB1]
MRPDSTPTPTPTPDLPYLALALALSLGAAVSLGVTRFAYGLLLPPMRADLQWSYTLAGAMNTANALGYLLGALAAPRLMARYGPSRLTVAGALLSSLFMGLSGFFTEAAPLLAQRLLAGVSSAFLFIAGGLLAARLSALQPWRGGFLLGLYYGGTGLGILLSALVVPVLLDAASQRAHPWAWAWWGLASACLAATVLLAWPARALQGLGTASTAAATEGAAGATGRAAPFRWRDFRFGLAGYTMFGMGYIGYMTFVIALLREQGVVPARITLFYALLGVAVVVSSRLWAGLLDRCRGGAALALLNTLAGLATVVPAVTAAWPMVMASGLLFGAVFLSVVASTTALVRHNTAPAQWATGISAFTVVFAAGQIVGPTIVGWIADGPGGLQRGLMFSAVALWTGAALASRQRALRAS